MTGSSVLRGSFRDPAGFVFRREGVLYRQVNEVHRGHFDALISSGLYEELLTEALLIPHELVDVEPEAPGAHVVIRPEPVAFISYPYEWCFSQLRDAAIATLEIQSRALSHGMSLRDATAYNVQFHRGRPTLIDTLSFEVLVEDRPWVAYRQFCQHFLAPLALMAHRDVRLGQLLRVHLDGIPLDLASELLPKRARMHPSLALHLSMHAKSQRKHASDEEPVSSRRGGFSLRAFRGLLDNLRSGIEKLPDPGGDSTWRDYYREASHYSAEAADRKQALVASAIERVAPATVWDLGANTGRFSRLASGRGIDTVSFDLDPFAVEDNERQRKAEGDTHLLPLVSDLTNPSPAIGWANEERMTLEQRGPADLVLALALVHHLAISNNTPLPLVADLFARLGRRALVEWVPKHDDKVKVLLRDREDIFDDYTQEGFERAFAGRFEIGSRDVIDPTDRVMYLLRSR